MSFPTKIWIYSSINLVCLKNIVKHFLGVVLYLRVLHESCLFVYNPPVKRGLKPGKSLGCYMKCGESCSTRAIFCNTSGKLSDGKGCCPDQREQSVVKTAPSGRESPQTLPVGLCPVLAPPRGEHILKVCKTDGRSNTPNFACRSSAV